jgi:type IV secretion system protein VirB11
MLRTALGSSIAAWLDDPAVIEVMLNPDGRLWVDRLGDGISDTGELLCAADGERIVRLVAHHVGVEVHAKSPRVSAELPEGGERFEGLLPPVVAAPAFAIRKPAVAVFTLDDYGAAGIMSAAEAAALRDGVAARANILVAGGTGSGKTTLVNALLAEVAKTADRIVLIEDTRELQCAAPNLVAMRTKDGVVSLSDLVRSSLRLRPDRIPIGEVRGAEALDLLKAWGPGTPAALAPSTLEPRSARCAVWNSSFRKPSSRSPRAARRDHRPDRRPGPRWAWPPSRRAGACRGLDPITGDYRIASLSQPQPGDVK